MSEAVQIALLATIAPTIAAIGAAILAVLTLRKTIATHEAVDGQTKALTAVTERAGFAEGKLEGAGVPPSPAGPPTS